VSVAAANRPRLASRWQSFEFWVGTRSSAAALFAIALAVFAVQSAVLPAFPGRDLDRYIQAFVQLGYSTPIYPAVLATRGPLAVLGVGVPLELGGGAAEAWLALLYAGSIVAWSAVALTFGKRPAVLTAVLLILYPGYGILFHELASDSLFAAAFAGWALLLTRSILRPSVKAFLVAGLGMGLLVLVRPANQVLIGFALLPLFLRGPWEKRLRWAAAFFVASAAVTQAWKEAYHLRYGDAVPLKPSGAVLAAAVLVSPLLFRAPWRRRLAVPVLAAAVAVVAIKASSVHNPLRYARSAVQSPSGDVFLYRAFELDRIVSPDNGPASREMGRVVQRELLTKEPYRSYGITLHEFFSSGSDRVFGDLMSLAGSVDLPAVTGEAIRSHPGTFASSIARTMWDMTWARRVYAPMDNGGSEERAAKTRETSFIVTSGRRLPRPSEGQPIPASRVGPQLWTTGGQAREVWRSATEHSYVFDSPRDARRYAKFLREENRLAGRIPTRSDDEALVHRLNQTSHVFPPPVLWLAVGVAALALRRPRRAAVALAPVVAGLLVIVATSLVAPAVAEYAAPVSPAFVLLAAVGLVGACPRGRPRLPSRRMIAQHGD
jgi:hypothetical protein